MLEKHGLIAEGEEVFSGSCEAENAVKIKVGSTL